MMPIVLEVGIEQLSRIIAVKAPPLFVAFADDPELLLFEIYLGYGPDYCKIRP